MLDQPVGGAQPTRVVDPVARQTDCPVATTLAPSSGLPAGFPEEKVARRHRARIDRIARRLQGEARLAGRAIHLSVLKTPSIAPSGAAAQWLRRSTPD